jgi:hypothetical protein
VTVEWDRIALTYNLGRLLAWARHEAQRSGATFMNALQPSSTPLWALAAGELAMTNDRRGRGLKGPASDLPPAAARNP